MEPAASVQTLQHLSIFECLRAYRQATGTASNDSHSDGVDGEVQKCCGVPVLSHDQLFILKKQYEYGGDADVHLAELDAYRLNYFKLHPADKAALRHLIQPVAVKEFGYGKSSRCHARSQQQLLKEARVFNRLGLSRAVPRLYGIINQVGCYQLVLELCQCNWWELNQRGLMKVYHGKRPASLAEVDIEFFKAQVTCARDAAAALRLLHAHKLIHCDVKPANFLVGRELVTPPGWEDDFEESVQEMGTVFKQEYQTVLKITDFARVQEQQQSSNRYPWQDGNLECDAPEVYQPVLRYQTTGRFEEAFLTDKSDVFALGITIAQILTFQSSFYPKHLSPDQQAQARSEVKYLPKNPSCVPECLWKVLEKCLKKNPEERPDMHGLMYELADALDAAVKEIEAAKGRTQAAAGSSASASLGSQLVTQEAAAEAAPAEAAPAAQPVQQLAMTQISAGGSTGSRRQQQQQQQHCVQASGPTAADGDSRQGGGTPPVAAAAGAAAVRAAEAADAATLDGISRMFGGLRLDAAATTAAAGGQPLCQLGMADASDWRSTRSSGQQQQHDSDGEELAAIASAASGSDHDQGVDSVTAALVAADSAGTGDSVLQCSTLLQPFATSTSCQRQQQPAAVHAVEDAEQHRQTAAALPRASPGQQHIQQAADEDDDHEDEYDIIKQPGAVAGLGGELTAAGPSSSAAAVLGSMDGLLPRAVNSLSSIKQSQLTVAAAAPTIDAQGGSNLPEAPIAVEAGAEAKGQPPHQLAMADVGSRRATRSRGQQQQQRQHPVKGKTEAAAAAGEATSRMMTRSRTRAAAATAAAVATKPDAGRRAGKAKALPQPASAVNHQATGAPTRRTANKSNKT